MYESFWIHAFFAAEVTEWRLTGVAGASTPTAVMVMCMRRGRRLPGQLLSNKRKGDADVAFSV